ncbi:MAG: CRISPR-associated helicase Cas3' [Ruminococcus sp.]|nr:CRISPR-associated helicase Cas3' [Ruminococcus sp.]
MKKINYIAGKSNYNNNAQWLPLKTHVLDTAGIIKKLYDNWLANSVVEFIANQLALSYDREKAIERGRDFCELVALLHDIGKLTPAFQSKIFKNIQGYADSLSDMGIIISTMGEVSKSHHAIAGQVILEEYHFPKEISIIIGSHHGKSQQSINQLSLYRANYFGKNGKQEKEWRQLWEEWIHEALEKTNFTIENLPKPNIPVQMILTGLLIMADWIASNTNYFPYIDALKILSDEQEIKNRITQAWDKLHFSEKWEVSGIYDFQELFKNHFGFSSKSFQNAVMKIVAEHNQSGIYILEAPMGVGKTETALAIAEILAGKSGVSGVYFGLPTQATANGIFGRIHEWTTKLENDETHTIRLAHGMTDLNDEYQNLLQGSAIYSEDADDETIIVHEWFERRKNALLADFVIATVDQFLLASLKQKHVMLRHLGLAGKVVIIDECHAYDAYMNIYLDHTLTWMRAYHVPVIILSATLPPQRRNALIKAYHKSAIFSDSCDNLQYPALTYINHDTNTVIHEKLENNVVSKTVSVVKLQEIDLIAKISEKLSDGGCMAVIVNTVNYAQELSSKFSEAEALQDFEIICFHSRFIATDRANIEKELLKRVGKDSKPEQRNKLIIVGTQVLEQSLDIDFDYMITELCPMDLLLQRSGRLHRHEKKRPQKLAYPELAILYSEERKNYIYHDWILWRTENYLPDKLMIPECIPELVSKVYAEPETIEESENERYKNYQYEIEQKQYHAKKYCIKSNLLKSKRKNTLAYFLDNTAENSAEAEACVRDTDETIEVLVLRKISENQYSLLSGAVIFDTTLTPNEDEAKIIAKGRLKLPQYFSKDFYATLKALDMIPKNWKCSKWLKGELLLLLDEENKTELLGKILYYSKEHGLKMK